ncbi:hypothetical protein FKP32DRAFT_1699472 [Trametes sanguinea]|nr:hypothetical protein FKP32DRAFT_1699472 [Trametes sanguinea]
MPFLADDAWPDGLRIIFDHARTRNATLQNRYYGPYDKLLNYCFGDSFTLIFYDSLRGPLDAVDFIIFLVVYDTTPTTNRSSSRRSQGRQLGPESGAPVSRGQAAAREIRAVARRVSPSSPLGPQPDGYFDARILWRL